MTLPESLREALADRYQIEEEVGVGGMATVFRARDLRHDRLVAITQLLAQSRRSGSRFADPTRIFAP